MIIVQLSVEVNTLQPSGERIFNDQLVNVIVCLESNKINVIKTVSRWENVFFKFSFGKFSRGQFVSNVICDKVGESVAGIHFCWMGNVVWKDL